MLIYISKDFGMLCFYFHLFSLFLKITFEISSLVYGLFRGMLFNFHMFRDFPVVFLLLSSTIIPNWNTFLI